METPALLSVRGLRAWYGTAAPVLDGVSFDVGAHEVVGLVGMNGSGKTTLVRCLAGVQRGCSWDGLSWRGGPFDPRSDRCKRLRAVVFSDEGAFAHLTFAEYRAYLFRAYGRPLAPCDDLVAGFGFGAYVDAPLGELSLGNRRKASLIAAFSLAPELLVLDEPVNGIDFEGTEFLYRCIRDYRGRGSVLFSSHVLESVTLTADRAVVLGRPAGKGGARVVRELGRADLDAPDLRERMLHG